MDEIELLIVLTINEVIIGAACIPFGLACKKKKNLLTFLFIFIFLTIGMFLIIFQFVNFIFLLLANIFFALAGIFLIISVSLEYYKIFIKPHNQNLTIRDKLIVTIIVGPVILGIYFFNIIIVLISLIMLFRNYLKNHSATMFFLLLIAISAIIIEISVSIQIYDIEGAYFFSTIITTFFVTLFFSTGFVALLEQKVIATSNEKNDLKDRYSHDLGNILHTITMAYDFSKTEQSSQIKKDELDNLIKGKITEASKLVKYIRNI